MYLLILTEAETINKGLVLVVLLILFVVWVAIEWLLKNRY